jgi:two-component system, LytTR family, response regulator
MKAIIIDDEPNAVELLALRLAQKCPQIEVVAQFTNSVKGVEGIKLHRPDIVFLDIEMPHLNGFQVLEAVEHIPFHLIFVTAYDKFALKAFRYSAIDYLLKPIEISELIEAVNKVESKIKTTKEQLIHFRNQHQNANKSLPDKIALPYQNGVTFVAIKDIVYCEADNTYTKIFLNDGQNFLITKTLLSIQEVLEEREFLRVHRQYIINLNQIKKYVKGEGNYLIMNNDKNIPIGRSQKEKLIERFGWL